MLKTVYQGCEIVRGRLLHKITVYRDGRPIDGAWGELLEITAWLRERGYPAPGRESA